jgi:hypothetical protein
MNSLRWDLVLDVIPEKLLSAGIYAGVSHPCCYGCLAAPVIYNNTKELYRGVHATANEIYKNRVEIVEGAPRSRSDRMRRERVHRLLASAGDPGDGSVYVPKP